MTKQEAIDELKVKYTGDSSSIEEAKKIAITCIKKCIEIETAVGTEIEHILFISNEAGADN